MLNLYIALVVITSLGGLIFYFVRIGKKQAKLKLLEKELESLQDAKEIRDTVDSMSESDRISWLQEHLKG